MLKYDGLAIVTMRMARPSRPSRRADVEHSTTSVQAESIEADLEWRLEEAKAGYVEELGIEASVGGLKQHQLEVIQTANNTKWIEPARIGVFAA